MDKVFIYPGQRLAQSRDSEPLALSLRPVA